MGKRLIQTLHQDSDSVLGENKQLTEPELGRLVLPPALGDGRPLLLKLRMELAVCP
jgi:hypothetical protein